MMSAGAVMTLFNYAITPNVEIDSKPTNQSMNPMIPQAIRNFYTAKLLM